MFTLICIPLMGTLFPIFFVQTFVYDQLAIILYPAGISFRLVVAACVLFFIGLLIVLIKQTKFTYSLLAVFAIASLIVFYLSMLSYTYIGKEKVVSNYLFNEKVLEWSEIEELVLEYYVDDFGTHEEYLFTSLDGDVIHIPLVKLFQPEDKSEIYNIAKQNAIRYIEREKQ